MMPSKVGQMVLKLPVPDQREVFTDEIKMPAPDESTNGLKQAPSLLNKLFECEIEDLTLRSRLLLWFTHLVPSCLNDTGYPLILDRTG